MRERGLETARRDLAEWAAAVGGEPEPVLAAAPALIITAEHDIVRPDGQQYARWLEAEGVAVEHHDHCGQLHGFLHMLGVTAAARHALDKAGDALRRAFVGGRRRGTPGA